MIAEQWAIYWWSVIENIQFFCVMVGVCTLFIGSFISSLAESVKGVAISITVGILFLLLVVFIPAKNDLALIFVYPYLKGGVEQAIQSDTMKKLTTISTKYLDKVIADLEKANDHK